MRKRFLFFLLFVFAITPVITTSYSTKAFANDEIAGEESADQEESDDDSLEGFEDDDSEEGVGEDDEEGFGEDDEEGFGEDDEGGIGEIKIDLAAVEAATVEESPYSFGGFFREDIAYSHQSDEPDFTKIRSTLNLYLDFKFWDGWKGKINGNAFYDYAYTRKGRDEFTDETLEAYESEAEIRDAYIEGGLTDWLRIKAGRQVIAWGQSDGTQITDMANPRDNREIGTIELEDARIPVAATRLSALFDSLEVSLVQIYEFRPNKIGTKGSSFDPLSQLRSPYVTINDEELPDQSFEHMLRVFKSFNGGDVSLIWADTYDDAFYLDVDKVTVTAAGALPEFTPRYHRIKTIGASGNFVSGSWLFKGELGKKIDKAYGYKDGVTRFVGGKKNWTTGNLLQGMMGFEYSGIQDLTIAVEGVLERIESYEDTFQNDEESGMMALTLRHVAMNDALNTDFFWFHFGSNNGDVMRLNVSYDMIDALNISGGAVAYIAPDKEGQLYSFRKNDQIYAKIKYSF